MSPLNSRKPSYLAPEYLVTGAAGFLGTQMVQYLLEQGKSVRATDIQEPKWLDAVKHRYSEHDFQFVKADLTDESSLDHAVKGIDYVQHFGALFRHDAKENLLMKINAEGTTNLFAACIRHDVRAFLHVGSMSVYGHEQFAEKGEQFAITEQKRPNPSDPYARSKQESREIAAFCNGANNMTVNIVDPAGIFGPGSFYGNAELIDMLLKGAMLLPDGGKHKASMVHSRDVVGICYFLMENMKSENYLEKNEKARSKDPQDISYLASDTTPLTGKELLEMIWQEIPEELQKPTLKTITQRIPLPRWLVNPIAKLTKQHQMMYGFGDHTASPEKIISLGYQLQFPKTEQTVKEVMNWHKEEGLIAKRMKKK
ncbi:MAG: NAD(P)-dependent oxidoreductase [Nanoarchaeota archaeon]|nr:NAD(P)-dependent oxidoreductase [Nanoarchaeota archaeon]